MKTSETLYQLAITMGSRFEQYPHHSFSENQYFLIIELWSEPRWETWRTELRSSDILMIFTSRGGGFRLDFLQRQIAVFDKNRNNVCSCLKTSQKSKAWGSAVIPEGSGMNFSVDLLTSRVRNRSDQVYHNSQTWSDLRMEEIKLLRFWNVS